MLLLNPRFVKFGSALWENVTAVAIDRQPQRIVEAFGDNGPYAVLVDVPEQRIRIRVRQEAVRHGLNAPLPGDEAQLLCHASPTVGDAGPRRRIAATAVVLAVEHEISLHKGAIRTITLAAVSATGASDPITITDL
jgi:hypothetical protein